MSMNDLGGTHRHPNEPDMGVRRVLPCVKCGDRHTVDVTAILEEGRRSNRPADASGGGEAEPTCRDCGLTREQIDWGWHSAPYEGQFATPPAPTPASEDGLRAVLAAAKEVARTDAMSQPKRTAALNALRAALAATTERPAEPTGEPS